MCEQLAEERKRGKRLMKIQERLQQVLVRTGFQLALTFLTLAPWPSAFQCHRVSNRLCTQSCPVQDLNEAKQENTLLALENQRLLRQLQFGSAPRCDVFIYYDAHLNREHKFVWESSVCK